MSRMGILAYLFAAVVSLAAAADAAPGAKIPPTGAKGAQPRAAGGIRINSFGEDPDQPFNIDPDTSDHQESWSREHGERNRGEQRPEEVSAPLPASETAADTAPSSTRPAMRRPRGGSQADMEVRVPADEYSVPDYVPAVTPAEILAQKSPTRRARSTWPRARNGKYSGRDKPAAELAVKETEDLRDAPASAARYSLWANLSTPLLLPPSQIDKVPLDRARAMGREDYATHILGSRPSGAVGAHKKGPAVFSARLGGRKGAPAAGRASFTEGAEAAVRDVFVIVDINIADFAGGVPAAAAALSEATGFELDERFAPRSLGAAGRSVQLHGRISLERFSEVMAFDRVERVSVTRPSKPIAEPQKGGRTEILMGLRIPPENSPTAALRRAMSRLGANTGLTLKRTIGYQRIPGTSRMVLIVSAEVPVRSLGRVLSDPAVVKVAPLPSQPVAAKADASRKHGPRQAFSSLITRHPFLLLIALLLTMSLIGQSFRGRS